MDATASRLLRRLPDLGGMSRQLAAQNDRLRNYLDSLPRRVDQLVEAAAREEWTEVRRVCEVLASTSVVFDCPQLTDAARRVCHEIEQPNNKRGVRESLLRLISRCGILAG